MIKYLYSSIIVLCISITLGGCNYATHRTLSGNSVNEDEDPEPNYEVSLGEDYQNYVSYIFMGNRNENFSTYFNKYFTSLEDYDDGMKEYKTLVIANYNRRLDSIYTLPVISTSVKEKLNAVIAKCSKIIQYNKNTRFLDASVLLIGKSYYYLQDFFQSERKFNEFLSKLSMSKLSDEALLFLGKTKLRLKKIDEGLLILNNLVEKSNDSDIKSEASQELALYFISQNNLKNGIDFIRKSIELSKIKETRAENKFLLARLYTTYDLQKAGDEYISVYDITSDFDLKFYSKLNYAKVLDLSGKPKEAFKILEDLSHKYRDYIDLKQMAEIELANSINLQGNFAEAREKYFYVIETYPSTKSSSEAYYRLGKHFEDTEKDFLKAYICYKKVNEQYPFNDYSDFCALRSRTFDKYFTLIATINDTTRGEIPVEIKELEIYKQKIDIEKGIDKEKLKGKDNENKIKNPKGGGFNSRFMPLDSVNEKTNDSLKQILEKEEIETRKEKDKDTNSSIKQGNDSLKLILEKQKQDSVLFIQQIKEDSLKNVSSKLKEQNKYNAYLELSELFTYELNMTDSAEYYITKAINFSQDINNQTKANYFLAILYKNQNRVDEANLIYRKIIETNSNSIFANESRKILGVTVVELGQDESEKLYKEAEFSITTNLFREALKPLEFIIANFNSSPYYPQALFATGWIFENIIGNKDSMIYFYKKLNSEFPQSEYSQSISGKIAFYTVDTTIKKDSLLISNDTTKITIDSGKVLLDSINQDIKLIDNPADTTKQNDEMNKINGEEKNKELPNTK